MELKETENKDATHVLISRRLKTHDYIYPYWIDTDRSRIPGIPCYCICIRKSGARLLYLLLVLDLIVNVMDLTLYWTLVASIHSDEDDARDTRSAPPRARSAPPPSWPSASSTYRSLAGEQI